MLYYTEKIKNYKYTEVIKMGENKFTSFVETYSEDIKAFIEALKAFVEALIAKFTAAPEEDAE